MADVNKVNSILFDLKKTSEEYFDEQNFVWI